MNMKSARIAVEEYNQRSLTAQLRSSSFGCVAKNRGRSVGIKFPSLFSLGCHSKQFSDEGYLTGDLSFLRFLHLALFDHMHHLISLQCSPCCLKGKEAHPWFDEAFDAHGDLVRPGCSDICSVAMHTLLEEHQ